VEKRAFYVKIGVLYKVASEGPLHKTATYLKSGQAEGKIQKLCSGWQRLSSARPLLLHSIKNVRTNWTSDITLCSTVLVVLRPALMIFPPALHTAGSVSHCTVFIAFSCSYWFWIVPLCYQAFHEIEFYCELWIKAPPPRAWILYTSKFMAGCKMVSSWLTNLYGIEVIFLFPGFTVLLFTFSYWHLRLLHRCCPLVHPPPHTPMLHREQNGKKINLNWPCLQSVM
jgi:hypothetical protein